MSWFRRLVNVLRPGRMHSHIDRELSFHIGERTDALIAEGVDPREAARRARRQFGSLALQADRTRDVDIALWLDAAVRNTRLAIRALTRAPGFTTAVVLTLALGIGANTAVFSAIDAVLLRPLPFPDADRLVRLTQTQEGTEETGIAPVRISDWHRLSTTFEAISGYGTSDIIDTRGDLPERFRRAVVAPRFLDVLKVRPALGRDFADGEYSLKAPNIMLVSDHLWRGRGADPHVLERPIRTDGLTIWTAGVMPAAFQFPDPQTDLWSPDDVDAPWAQSRRLTWYTGIGRLRPDVTREQARADLERVQARLAEQYPNTDRGIGIRVEPLKDTVVGSASGSLWLLFGAVSVLLLVACTNIAALLLSRAARREHEVAVRYSLGGSRAAVAGQVLAETAVLAVSGAALGLVVAVGASRAIRLLAPDLPRVDEIAVDARILLYTLAATVIVAVLCGLLPAARSARGAASLSRSSRTQVSTRHSLQWLLVGVQVALSVTLLAGAGLLLRSGQALSRVNHGFDPASVLTLRVSGSYGTETTDNSVQRINRVLDELAALPQVEEAAIASALSGVRAQEQQEFEIAEDRDGTAPPLLAESRIVSPGYFDAMQIPVLAGQLCRRPPDAGAAKALVTEAMVNRRFADRYMPGRSAIGLHVAGSLDYLVRNGHLAGAAPARIVGIVGDARELGADRDPVPTVYTCFSAPSPAPWFLVRTHREPLAAVAAVRRKIGELEPRRAVYDIAPLEERLGAAYAQNRLRTWLLSLFAATALGLVCAGVYGTLSYAVSLRRREVALRLALGARRHSVVRQLTATGIRIVGVGCIGGLIPALVFGQGLSTMLYGVTPTDPVTLAAVLAVVIIVAALAALVPAARAAFVQPMRALREE